MRGQRSHVMGWCLALCLVPADHAQTSPDSALVGGALRLTDALDITLKQAPELLVAEQQVAESQGALQEQAGLFDHRFMAESLFQFASEELIGSRLEQERERRLRLEIFAAALDLTADSIIQELDEQDLGRLSLLFQNECRPDQTRLVITAADGRRIILCRNFSGQITGISSFGDGSLRAGLSSLDDILDSNGDLNEKLKQDIAAAFADRLRNIARLLHGISASLALQRTRLGDLPEDEQFLELNLTLAQQLRFRTGVSISPFLSLRSTEQNFAGKPLRPSFGDSLEPNTFSVTAGIDLFFPLGQGRGRTATTAPERAAEATLAAQRHLMAHSQAERTLAATLTYWRLAAAQERYRLLADSLELRRGIHDSMLRRAKEHDASRADVARTESRRRAIAARLAKARQQVIEARFDLLREMGLTAARLGHAPLAKDPLPPAVAEVPPASQWLDGFEGRRQDIRAAAESERASGILAEGAKLNLRHQLDLSLNIAYNAFGESFEERLYEPAGFAGAVDGLIAGPSYGFGLRWRVPLRNRAARGRHLQAEAAVQRSRTVRADLERGARRRILDAHARLTEIREEASQLDAAVVDQQWVLESSRKLFADNLISVIDLLQTEEQLVDLRLSRLASRLRAAELEATLRFESGGLAPPEPTEETSRAALRPAAREPELAP